MFRKAYYFICNLYQQIKKWYIFHIITIKNDRKCSLTNDGKKWYNLVKQNKADTDKGGIRMASVQAVCNTFLVKSFTESVPVSPMKLQKLIYFAYRNYIKKTGRKAFNDSIQTWKYGPVVQSVYDEFKSFGKNTITQFAKDAQGKVYVVNESAIELIKSINDVWNKYKCYSGIDLSKMTHEEGTAWSKAFHENRPFLDDEDIKNECSCG